MAPHRVLPIILDFGTDNEEMLADQRYRGVRHPRLRGDEYFSLVDEFMKVSLSLPRPKYLDCNDQVIGLVTLFPHSSPTSLPFLLSLPPSHYLPTPACSREDWRGAHPSTRHEAFKHLHSSIVCRPSSNATPQRSFSSRTSRPTKRPAYSANTAIASCASTTTYRAPVQRWEALPSADLSLSSQLPHDSSLSPPALISLTPLRTLLMPGHPVLVFSPCHLSPPPFSPPLCFSLTPFSFSPSVCGKWSQTSIQPCYRYWLVFWVHSG